MKRLAWLVILAFVTGVSGQTPAVAHNDILRSIGARDYLTAIADLEKLRQADKQVFALNNYDYLLARLHDRAGHFSAAVLNYQLVVDRNSELKEYALRHLAEIMRSAGNLPLERIYLRELLTVGADSLIGEAGGTRVARSHLESGDFETAAALFRSALITSGVNRAPTDVLTRTTDDVVGNLTGNDARSRENLVLLGRAYLQGGKPEKARQVFTKLVDESRTPDQPDDFALEGARGLDILDVGPENFGKIAPILSDTEQLKRASIFQFNRDFESARLHYQALVARGPKNNDVPVAMYQIARGFAQEGNFSSAAEWFERVQIEFPLSPVAQDALYQSASAYTRVNKTKEAVSRYQKYFGQYPDAKNRERAYLNIVDIMRDKGEIAGAISWTAKTRDAFRGSIPEAVAIFAQSRIHLSQQDWEKALVNLESLRFLGNLGGPTTPGGTGKEEVLFLKGFVLERLGRFEEAVDVYLTIPDGRSKYFGWRANQRLQALLRDPQAADVVRRKFYPLRMSSGQPVTARSAEEIRTAAQSAIRLTDVQQTREQLLETVRKAYSYLPEYQKVPEAKLLEFGRHEVLSESSKKPDDWHQTLADELLFLGLYDEGAPELEIAAGAKSGDLRSGPPDDVKFTLAVLYERGGLAGRASEYVEPLWKKVPADYQIELIPRGQLELLYPAPYADALLRHTKDRGVDPRFVLSIMRQESRFRADVKSTAAARGLMQFISSTSNKIANQLGKETFEQDELYDPPTAILFGTQYLSNLFHKFPGQPQAVAAGYNGGEDNMERWVARSSSNDPDRYVPEILFAQTKDYVFKVMENYRIYQMLYDENLKLTEANDR